MSYKRILLKLSGEALMGKKEYGIDSVRLSDYAKEIYNIHSENIQIAIVIGGGNIYRGIQSEGAGFDRVQGDHMGMLATIINGMALQSALEKIGIQTRLLTAIRMEQVAEPYIRRKAIRHLEKNRIVIFAGGTGNPYFTTDTAAALRAIEIKSDIIIKATKVDGVYDSDPFKNSDAVKYDSLSYKEVIDGELKVMDLTAITLCKENKLPISVININSENNLENFLFSSNKIGTIIS